MPTQLTSAQLKAACARITAGNMRGTGFLVSAERLLTCYHVIKDAGGQPIVAMFPHGQYAARVELVDAVNDCALLHLERSVPASEVQPLALSPVPVPKGTPWEGYGFPAATGQAGLLIDGRVQDPEGHDPDLRSAVVLQSANVTAGAGLQGFSGSPVLVGDKVVGQMRQIIPDEARGAQMAVVYACPAGPLTDLARRRLGARAFQSANPYRGLAAFQATESHLFFGREMLSEKLWERFQHLRAHPEVPWLLAILGPSGSGKSSVARAGLLAALEKRPIPGSRPVRTAVLKPGEHPIRALVLTLLPPVPGQAPDLGAQSKLIEDLSQPNKRGEFDRLTLWAANLPDAATSPLVLLVDQFEEAYTLCPEQQERDAFVGMLLHAARDRARHIAVVLTLRADFLGETQRQHPELNRLFGSQAEIVTAMSPEGLRQVIAKPAEQAGCPIDEATIDLLLSQAQGSDGALPLLEFGLTRIWEGMQAGEEPGTILRQIGGVGGALAGKAREIYEVLTAAEQATARRALVRLVKLGEGTRDTRRRAPLGELCGREESEAAVLSVLRKFSTKSARLVTLSGDEASVIAEVTHEALFEHWNELRTWIDQSRTDRGLHDRAMDTATRWKADGQPVGRLWRTPDLELLRDYRRRKPDELSQLQEEFLDSSEALRTQLAMREEEQRRREHQRTRQTRLAAGVLGVLFVAAMAAGLQAYRKSVLADQKADEARQKSDEAHNGLLVAVAQSLKDDPTAVATVLREAAIRDSTLWLQAASDAVQTGIAETILPGHWFEVSSVAFSPDGTKVLTVGSSDNTVRIWNADGSGVPLVLKGSSPVAFSRDGKKVLTGSDDNTVRIWNADGSGVPLVIKGRSPVAFSPEGNRYATWGKDNTIRVWNADGSGVPLVLKGKLPVAFSPDGKKIVTSSEESSVRIWNAEGSGSSQVLEGPRGGALSVAFSPDGKRIVVGGVDEFLYMFNVDGPGPGYAATAHVAITSVAFSPDGKRIVTGSRDKTARIWNADALGVPPRLIQGHQDNVTSVAFSPDGKRVVTGSRDKTARIWNVNGATIPIVAQDYRANFTSVAFSPDGKRVVTGSKDKTARVWNADGSGALLTLNGHQAPITSVAFSPDGKQLVSGSEDGNARIWNADGSSDSLVLNGQARHPITSVAFSPDGKRVVTGADNACIWRADGSDTPRMLQGHQGYLYSVAFSPDGKRVVAGSRDKTARIWNADGSGDSIVLRGHQSDVYSVAFSPDGKKVVTGSMDRTARIWNSDGVGDPIVLQGSGMPIMSVAFSPDGKKIAVSTALAVGIWNADGTGDPLKLQEQGFMNLITGVAFSPDGMKVVTSSPERVSIWTIGSDALFSSLWDATTNCLPLDRRRGLLLEPPMDAKHGYERCRQEVARRRGWQAP